MKQKLFKSGAEHSTSVPSMQDDGLGAEFERQLNKYRGNDDQAGFQERLKRLSRTSAPQAAKSVPSAGAAGSAASSSTSSFTTSGSSATTRHSRRFTKFFKKLNRRSTDTNEEKNFVLFEHPSSRMTVYEAESHTSGARHRQGSLISQGVIQVYQLVVSKTNFLVCGEKLVHPLMRTSKVFRTGTNVFVLPLYNPERYWKLEVGGDIAQFIAVLRSICDYKDLTDDAVIEERSSESPTLLPMEKMDVELTFSSDMDATLSEERSNDNNANSNANSNDDQDSDANSSADNISEEHAERPQITPSTSQAEDPQHNDQQEPTTVALQSEPLEAVVAAGPASIASYVGHSHMPSASTLHKSIDTIQPKSYSGCHASYASEKTYISRKVSADAVVPNVKTAEIEGAADATTPIVRSAALEHPVPVRPISTISSLDIAVSRFDQPSEEVILCHKEPAWMDLKSSAEESKHLNERFSLTFKAIKPGYSSESAPKDQGGHRDHHMGHLNYKSQSQSQLAYSSLLNKPKLSGSEIVKNSLTMGKFQLSYGND